MISSDCFVIGRGGYRWVFGNDGGKDVADGAVDIVIGTDSVGNIDEGEVDSFIGRKRKIRPGEPVGFADTATHSDAVDGMLQPFFRH